jgi:aryl-alcohol dehydrogenase-like predicted oxidoreductase
MRYRLFGSTGLRVSELFLGAMTFGEQGGVGAPPEECRRILDAFADAGGNVVDTAINYRGGASEEILGELLAGRRDRFVLSTKYTVTRDPGDPNAAGSHRKNLRLSLETSLRRLRTDYIDIYWVHVWDRHTPAEETLRALDDQVRAGKILYLGISDAPAWVISRQYPGRLARLDAVRRPAGALQPAAPRHRSRTAADGRDPGHDGRRLEPARRRDPVRQVHPGQHSQRNPH